MQWAALSASQSESSFSLGCLSLHLAAGMPLMDVTHAQTHDPEMHMPVNTKRPICQYIIIEIRGGFKEEIGGKMTGTPPPLTF